MANLISKVICQYINWPTIVVSVINYQLISHLLLPDKNRSWTCVISFRWCNTLSNILVFRCKLIQLINCSPLTEIRSLALIDGGILKSFQNVPICIDLKVLVRITSHQNFITWKWKHLLFTLFYVLVFPNEGRTSMWSQIEVIRKRHTTFLIAVYRRKSIYPSVF